MSIVNFDSLIKLCVHIHAFLPVKTVNIFFYRNLTFKCFSSIIIFYPFIVKIYNKILKKYIGYVSILKKYL